jgi:EmrB/QacA subfamily drug resistance transporter
MTKRDKILITVAMMVGMLIASLDQTIVDTAFPKMISELGGVSMFSWVITAYLLASTSIVPMVGKLADMFGRKLFWNIGIIIFVGGSVLCGQAHNMTELIVFRGIQGIGGGMIMPIAQTIIGDVYTGEQRAKMQGVFTSVFALGSAIGPLLGGYIVDHFHWKYIFLLNLPTGVIALLLSAKALTNVTSGKGRKLDWLGSVLSVTGITAILLALQMGGDQWAWTSWQSIGLFGGGAALLVGFAFHELHVAEPILDLRLFVNRTFATFVAVAFVLGMGMFGAIVFVPWFIQGVVGVSATNSGTVMLPMTIMMMVGSFAGGQVARRIAYRWQIAGGLLLVVAGFFLATRFTLETTLWQARIAIMFIGLGLGLVMPLITLGVQQAFGRNMRGVVTSATSFFRSVGATVGVTVFGILFNKQMTIHYNELMAPQLKALPPAFAAKVGELAAKPSDLVQVLLQKPLQEMIPQQFRANFVGIIKTMMADSIHPVFWTGLVVIVVGILIGQFLGRESLTNQIRQQAALNPEEGDGDLDEAEPAFVGH